MSIQPILEGNKNIRLMYLQAFFGNGFFDRAIFMLYLTQKGYSLWEIGLLQTLVNLPMFVLEIPSGMFADRFGRKISLILGRFMFILYFIGMLYSHNFYMFGLTFFCLGIGATLLSGAEEALMYESAERASKREQYNRIAGKNIAIFTLSLAIAMGAGGFLAQISWQLVFIVSLGFQLISFVTVLLLKEINKSHSTNKKPFFSFITDTSSFLKMNKQVQLLIVGIALFVGVSSIYFLFAQDVLQEQGIKKQSISLIFSIVSLLSAVISDRTYLFVQRLSLKSVLLFTVLASAVLYGLLLIKSVWISIPVFVVINLLYYVFYPITLNMIQQEIPSNQRATLLSVMSFLSSFLMACIAPLVGYMSEKIGIELFLGIIGVVSSILAWFGLRKYLLNTEKAKLYDLKGGEIHESYQGEINH